MNRSICVLLYSAHSQASQRLFAYIESLDYEFERLTGLTLLSVDNERVKQRLIRGGYNVVPVVIVGYYNEPKLRQLEGEDIYKWINAHSDIVKSARIKRYGAAADDGDDDGGEDNYKAVRKYSRSKFDDRPPAASTPISSRTSSSRMLNERRQDNDDFATAETYRPRGIETNASAPFGADNDENAAVVERHEASSSRTDRPNITHAAMELLKSRERDDSTYSSATKGLLASGGGFRPATAAY